MQAVGSLKDKSREEIEGVLGQSDRTTDFVNALDGWIEALNHPASFYRKAEIVKPRSAKAYQTVEAARKAAVGLDEKIVAICELPAYRWPADLSDLKKISDDLRQHIVFLEDLAERVRPLGPTGQDKRLYTQRYALRGLMWLFKRHLPKELISYVPASRFSRIADIMLKEIGYSRVDLRELIKQEKAIHSWFLHRYPVSGHDDLMAILMEP